MWSRFTLLLAVLLMASLALLAGCAPRATGGMTEAVAGADQVFVDMPAIVIDIHSDGQSTVGNMPVSQLGAMLNADLSQLSVDPAWVEYFTATNIQHIQIDNTPDGLLVLVNGEPIPSLMWDGNTLVATAELIEQFGGGIALLEQVLPLLRNIGIAAIIRFPVAAGTELIPYVIEGSDTAAARARAAQEAYLASVGAPPKINLIVNYAEDGTWSVADLSNTQWREVLPIPWEALNLAPDVVANASQAGIQNIGIASNADGIHLSLNGNRLPSITWGSGEVNHVLDLAQQMGLIDAYLGNDPSVTAILGMVTEILPVVQASNVSITVNFP